MIVEVVLFRFSYLLMGIYFEIKTIINKILLYDRIKIGK